jgi:hypothetical protein
VGDPCFARAKVIGQKKREDGTITGADGTVIGSGTVGNGVNIVHQTGTVGVMGEYCLLTGRNKVTGNIVDEQYVM